MKMSSCQVLALALGVVALAGCSTPMVNSVENTPKAGQAYIINDKRVITDSSLGRSVAIVAVNTATTPAGFLRAQVELKNHTFFRQSFLYRFEWFDASGMQVNNIVSANLSDQLEGGESKFISGIAPTPDCKDFREKLISGN